MMNLNVHEDSDTDVELTEDFRDLCLSPLRTYGGSDDSDGTLTPTPTPTPQHQSNASTKASKSGCAYTFGTPRRDPLKNILTKSKSIGNSFLSQRIIGRGPLSSRSGSDRFPVGMSPSVLSEIVNLATPRSLPSYGITNHSRRSIMTQFSALKKEQSGNRHLQVYSDDNKENIEYFDMSQARRQCKPKLLFQNPV